MAPVSRMRWASLWATSRAKGLANRRDGARGAASQNRLGTTVPDYRIPLLPVKDGNALRLKRGALPAFGEGGIQGVQRPKGRLLEPDRELLLFEEEMSREGARLTRTYQYARWIDGSTHLWIGRRKAPDRGEGSSGLQFDTIIEGVHS